jgi:hypothetical protein
MGMRIIADSEQIAEFPLSRTFPLWHRGSDGPNYRSDGIRIIVDLKPDHGVSSKRYDASLDRGSHGP